MNVTDEHRALYHRLNHAERRWVARRTSTAFPVERVSPCTLAALPRGLLAQLVEKVEGRQGESFERLAIREEGSS